ncbi:MAG: M48 family metallopeptidase [Pseudomonadota bacterium]
MIKRYAISLTLACSLYGSLSACVAPQSTPPKVSDAAALEETEKQKEWVVRRLMRDNIRIYTVGAPILTASAPLCEEVVRPHFGFLALNMDDFGLPLRAAAGRTHGLGHRLQIVAVAPGSPAARAGLLPGDQLIEVAGVKVQSGKGARERLKEDLGGVLATGAPLDFQVLRGERFVTTEITPTMQCDYGLKLINEDDVNAYADGETIILTTGMMRFATSDQHLAVIIGHELAHNALEHRDAKEQNQTAGRVGGLLFDVLAAVFGVYTGGAFSDAGASAGAQAYSVDFEREADYVGLYMMALAGYPLEGSADFWRMMAADSPGSIYISTTHPTTPERAAAIESYIAEIRRKQAQNIALVPEGIEIAEPDTAVAAAPVALSGPSTPALALDADSEPKVEAIAAVRSPQSGRWIGEGARDTCGLPWAMDLRFDRGRLSGQFQRGETLYDVHGQADHKGRLTNARAGKNKLYSNVPGPRFIDVLIDMKSDRMEGSFSVDDAGHLYCRTAFTLDQWAQP